MNAEQKQRAQEARQEWVDYEWSGADSGSEFEVVEIANKMAALLQELIEAPEPEPVGYFKSDPFGWTDCAETDDGAIALYTAPPAPSVPGGWRPFLTDVITAAGLLEHGKRDKGLAGRIGKFAFDAMRAAPTPAEAPADVARDAARYRWLRTHGLQRAWVSLGTDFEGDNFASFRCEFNLPEPPNLPYEDDEGLQWADKDFDAAIDAAIEREILGGGE